MCRYQLRIFSCGHPGERMLVSCSRVNCTDVADCTVRMANAMTREPQCARCIAKNREQYYTTEEVLDAANRTLSVFETPPESRPAELRPLSATMGALIRDLVVDGYVPGAFPESDGEDNRPARPVIYTCEYCNMILDGTDPEPHQCEDHKVTCTRCGQAMDMTDAPEHVCDNVPQQQAPVPAPAPTTTTSQQGLGVSPPLAAQQRRSESAVVERHGGLRTPVPPSPLTDEHRYEIPPRPEIADFSTESAPSREERLNRCGRWLDDVITSRGDWMADMHRASEDHGDEESPSFSPNEAETARLAREPINRSDDIEIFSHSLTLQQAQTIFANKQQQNLAPGEDYEREILPLGFAETRTASRAESGVNFITAVNHHADMSQILTRDPQDSNAEQPKE